MCVYLHVCCCSSSAEVLRACPASGQGAETGRHDDPHLEPPGTQTHTNLKCSVCLKYEHVFHIFSYFISLSHTVCV